MGLILSPIACVAWIIVGAVAGGLAHQFVGAGRSQGFVSDMILGLIGAVVGGMILSVLGMRVEGTVLNPLACIGHIVVATFGASVLIVLGRTVMGQSRG